MITYNSRGYFFFIMIIQLHINESHPPSGANMPPASSLTSAGSVSLLYHVPKEWTFGGWGME